MHYIVGQDQSTTEPRFRSTLLLNHQVIQLDDVIRWIGKVSFKVLQLVLSLKEIELLG